MLCPTVAIATIMPLQGGPPDRHPDLRAGRKQPPTDTVRMNDANAPFKQGDVVVHPKRPEWGDGRVELATPIRHNGEIAQRLIVRFAHEGKVTINTAFAPLNRKDVNGKAVQPAAALPSSQAGGWLGSLEGSKTPAERLAALPDELSDPFLSHRRRLELTLETYRFSTEPRALIDWAITQTGLHDPLTEFTRTELEAAFPRYDRDRRHHLEDLVAEMKRNNQQQDIRDVLSKTERPVAKQALQKAMRG